MAQRRSWPVESKCVHASGVETNNVLVLVQRVTDFEEDFSSGYLFGELLWKFNQQSDFEEFSKK